MSSSAGKPAPPPSNPARAAESAAALSGWRLTVHTVIFEADTPGGKAFDVALIGAILLSVLVTMLDTVQPFGTTYGYILQRLEWGLTILFTVEYVLRLVSVGRSLAYATSFFGVIDLLAIVPTYIGVFVPGAHYLTVIRLLRVLRVFRVLKLGRFVTEAQQLRDALRGSRHKIIVFVFAVLTLVVVVGSLMYVIEGAENGFTSIPRGVYWAIVTVTTVGFGDVAPNTPLGQTLASILMVTGYGIIAVPTGIVTAELQRSPRGVSTQACPECSLDGHAQDAVYCKACGARL